MVESDDLTAQLEKSPENHELRWTLAKRLYRIGDYRSALKHLQVLREEWQPKINVVRYLAAVYYRLGRYDQAIAELEDAIDEWPVEIPLREQLARVFEVAGRKDRSIWAWKKILEINPEHDLARQALARLSFKTPPHYPEFVPGLDDRDLGLDGGTGLICPKCGTLNTGDFDQCWKCNAFMGGKSAPQLSEPEPAVIDMLAVWHIAAKAGTGLFIAVGGWLVFHQYVTNGVIYDDLIPLTTIHGLLDEKMFFTRLILGVALVAGWPLGIWTAVTLVKANRIEMNTVIWTGTAFGAAMFDALWLPFFLKVFVVPLLVVLPVLPVMFWFPAERLQRVLIAMIQAIIIVCVIYLTVALREGNTAVAAIPTLVRYSTVFDVSADPAYHLMPPLTAPLKTHIKWDSTGNVWLDGRVGRSLFSVSSSESEAQFLIEISDGDRSVYYGRTTQLPFRFLFEPQPQKNYQLSIDGPIGASIEITVLGILTPRIEQ